MNNLQFLDTLISLGGRQALLPGVLGILGRVGHDEIFPVRLPGRKESAVCPACSRRSIYLQRTTYTGEAPQRCMDLETGSDRKIKGSSNLESGVKTWRQVKVSTVPNLDSVEVHHCRDITC